MSASLNSTVNTTLSGTGVQNAVLPSTNVGDLILLDYNFNSSGTLSAPINVGNFTNWQSIAGNLYWAYCNVSSSNVNIGFTLTGGGGQVGVSVSSWSGTAVTTGASGVTSVSTNAAITSAGGSVSGVIPNNYIPYLTLFGNGAVVTALSVNNSTNLLTSLFTANNLAVNYGSAGSGISKTFTASITAVTFSGTLSLYAISSVGASGLSIAQLPNKVCNAAKYNQVIAFSDTVSITPVNGFAGFVNLSILIGSANVSPSQINFTNSNPIPVTVSGTYVNAGETSTIYEIQATSVANSSVFAQMEVGFSGCGKSFGPWLMYLSPDSATFNASAQNVSATLFFLPGTYNGVINLTQVNLPGCSISGLPASVNLGGGLVTANITLNIAAGVSNVVSNTIYGTDSNNNVESCVFTIIGSGGITIIGTPPAGDFAVSTDLPLVKNNGSAASVFGAVFVLPGQGFADTITLTATDLVTGVSQVLASTSQSVAYPYEFVFPFTLSYLAGLGYNDISVVKWTATGTTSLISHSTFTQMVSPKGIGTGGNGSSGSNAGFAASGSELRHASLKR